MLMLPAPLADLERAYLSIAEEVSSGVLTEEFAASLLREATARDADGHLWCVDLLRCGSSTEFAVIDEVTGQLVPASPSAFSLKPGQAPGPIETHVGPESTSLPSHEEGVFFDTRSTPGAEVSTTDLHGSQEAEGFRSARRLHPAVVCAVLIALVVGLVALFGSDGSVEEAPAFEPEGPTTSLPTVTAPPVPEVVETVPATTEPPFEPELFNGLPGAEQLPSF